MFINKTNKYKFTGKFTLSNIVYIYILYLPHTKNKNNYNNYSTEIIEYFGNRYVNGSKCLNIDSAYINKWMLTTSAYVIIYREHNPDDVASCSITIHDPCKAPAIERDFNVYIYDLCRAKPSKVTYTSPVYGLFYFIENLTYQNLSKTRIYLMVNTSNSSTNKLIEIYTKYGFMLQKQQCISALNRIILYKPITKKVTLHSSLSLFYLLNNQHKLIDYAIK